jgi:hypothetical protein
MKLGPKYALVAVAVLLVIGIPRASHHRDPYGAGYSLCNCAMLVGGVAYLVGRLVERRKV